MLDLASPRLQRLQQELANAAPGALGRFWEEAALRGTPLVEPGPPGSSLVTFLWKEDGEARSVAVIQDWGADGIREHFMERLPGSDVWFLTRVMPSDTRTTYQLSPSPLANLDTPAPYRLDPLNPNTYTAYLSETGSDILFSLLECPDAPPLPWRHAVLNKAGEIHLQTPFADGRRLWVYLPAGRGTEPLPLLLVFDGRLYKDQLHLPQILDYLIEMGQIPPVAALMLDNTDRSELCCRPAFAGYVVNEVLPWLTENYPVGQEREKTTVLGSSLGGLAAVYLALTHPGRFGRVFSQTGWFRWRPDGDHQHHWITRQLAAVPQQPIRFWLQVGSLEVAQMKDGGPTQLYANRLMRDTLLAKGYAVWYQEYSGGHDASSLEAPLAKGLTEILGE